MQYDNEIPDPDEFITQLLHRLEINTEHSSASMAEVEHLLQNDGLDDPELIDLTHLPFVTIDNPDSRDLDQALLIERHAERYRIRYALADASFYVKPHSALFQEALTRGSSYYTPTVAIPMLPVELSEGLISLNPNVSRRA
ncbi:MAG: RNB domain-containing ribonuclease, partial [Granulosicoccus sp.]|nr:RNB domain-containing ribonuclease [Granulosicoccus sp.]